MFAVCLVQLGLVQSQAISCTSNQPDTDCTASNSCGAEHPPEGTSQDQYIDDTCDPGFMISGHTYSMPETLERQLCPNFVSCDDVADIEESTRYEGRPEVNVRLETVSIYRFDVHISWEHNPVTSRERRRGYQVRVRNEMGIAECFCVNDSDARNLTVTGSISLIFNNAEDLTVEVAPYPLPNVDIYVKSITGKYSSKWPSSCLDLGTHNCYPPKYPPPSNVHLCTYNENTSALRLDTKWDTAMPYSSWNNTSDRFTYYLQLVYHEPAPPDDDPLLESDYYKVTSTGNTSQLSVSLYLLNTSVEYAYIRLRTHYPCSGVATIPIREIGCGDPSPNYSIPPRVPSCTPPSSVSPGTTISPSIPSSTTISPSAPSSNPSPFPSPTVEVRPKVLAPHVLTVAVVIPTLTILVVVTIATVLIVLKIFKKRPRPEIFSGDFPVPPCPIITCKKRVVVFFSLRSKNVEYILCNVVQRLQLTGDIEVTHPHDLIRDLIPEWIEDKVMKADTVLIVCDKAFYEDWNNENSSHVNALRHVFFSKVMNRSSGMKKFAVIVLDNKDQYIPTQYLRLLSKFNYRKDNAEDIKPIVHFIRNTSPYVLASVDHVESGAKSPMSDITIFCTPDHPTHFTTSSTETFSERSSPSIDTSSEDFLQ